MIEHMNFNDRAARLAEIKHEIAAGTYDTDWRLSLAVDALWEQLEPPSLEGDVADGTSLEDPDEPHRPRQPR